MPADARQDPKARAGGAGVWDVIMKRPRPNVTTGQPRMGATRTEAT